MAKPRKSYRKRPLWHFLVLYLVIGAIIYGLLFYTGVIDFGFNGDSYPNGSSEETQEVEYFE